MKHAPSSTRVWLPFIIPVVIVVIVRVVAVAPTTVAGSSMAPTIAANSLIMVHLTAYGLRDPFNDRYLVLWQSPQINDIVVFNNPLDTAPAIKRCIAVAGDPVTVEESILVINGHRMPLAEPQVRWFARFREVPPATFFALGDNLPQSNDSRHFGFVAEERLVGRVIIAIPIGGPVFDDRRIGARDDN